MTVHEQNGIKWYYPDPDTTTTNPQYTCHTCGRSFVANQHYNDGEHAYCPECHPIKSLSHQIQDTLNKNSKPPRLVGTKQLLKYGDPR